MDRKGEEKAIAIGCDNGAIDLKEQLIYFLSVLHGLKSYEGGIIIGV